MSDTINVSFLLEEITARAAELEQSYVFSDPFEKAFHDGQLKEVYDFSVILKKMLVQNTPTTAQVNPTSLDKTNDPNFLSTNLKILLQKVDCQIVYLQSITVFPDALQKTFHAGQLAELLSIKALILSLIYTY